MIFSYNWIKEYTVAALAPEEVAERLTMAGIEVEAVEEVRPGINGVVTAEILSIGRHPNADRLVLCAVGTGEGRTCSVVCGAKNMKEGDRVALALVGALLPGGLKLKRTKIRGVVSEGMMCSEVELGLSDRSKGIMILPPDTPLGREVVDALGLSDTLFHVAVLPNRADCLSIRGLAREIAVVTGSRFRAKKTFLDEKGMAGAEAAMAVTVEEAGLCRRYAGRVIEDVTVGQSPAWLKTRLELHGIRSINNIVDATNYVMLETGQPLHAFDMDRLKGREVVVRKARNDESIETIDGRRHALAEDMLVIADAEAPQAVAGVMGGRASEVTDKTRAVFLESACFEPASVRRTSKRLSLSTDSSYRFERGVDVEGVAEALDSAASLIAGLAGGALGKDRFDVYPEKYKPEAVEFSTGRAAGLLGVSLRAPEVKRIFKGLGIEVRAGRKKGVISAVPPSYRSDLRLEADLIEEVARLIGYDRIPEKAPHAVIQAPQTPPFYRFKKLVRDILVSHGFYEVIHYSFVPGLALLSCGPGGRSGVPVLNPLTEEQAVLRDSLMPSLVSTLEYNLARKNEEARIFEMRPVFVPTEGGLPLERWMVGALMYGHAAGGGWNQGARPIDFYDMKGVIEGLAKGLGIAPEEFCCEPPGDGAGSFFHPGRSARLSVGGEECGAAGELHPDVMERHGFRKPAYLFEIRMETLFGAGSTERRYVRLPRFPESSRDIAFLVDASVPYGEIRDAAGKTDTKLIENVELFDVYYGEKIPAGKRSLALRITYRSPERTLTCEEVERIHTELGGRLAERFGAEIRS